MLYCQRRGHHSLGLFLFLACLLVYRIIGFIYFAFILCHRCHCCLFQSGVIEQHDVTLKWDWTRSRKSWRTYRSVVEAFLLTRQENRANPPTARLPLLAYLLPLFYEQHEEHECRSENCCIPAGNCRHRRHGCEKRTRKASWSSQTHVHPSTGAHTEKEQKLARRADVDVDDTRIQSTLLAWFLMNSLNN